MKHHPNAGEGNGRARLTDQQVRDIWAQYWTLAMSVIDLARLYRVSPGAIYYALRIRGHYLGMREPRMLPDGSLDVDSTPGP